MIGISADTVVVCMGTKRDCFTDICLCDKVIFCVILLVQILQNGYVGDFKIILPHFRRIVHLKIPTSL